MSQVAAIGAHLPGPEFESSRARVGEVTLSQTSSGPVTVRHKPATVDLSLFHGDDPEAWIFQVERYFDFYSILPNHKLSLASFYLEGEALDWYRWLFRTH